MNAISPLREPADYRIGRQAAYFRELSELNMAAARIAAKRIEQADAAPDSTPDDTAKPTLDLARATRAVVQSVNAENNLFRSQPPPRAPAGDPRRAPLRQALHKAAEAEPNPAIRAELRREIDTVIEEALVADPDAETPLCEHLFALAEIFNLAIDPAKLSDELLGIEPRSIPRDGPHPGSADTGDPLCSWPGGPA